MAAVADVVIIGAGIQGLSAAYHLAKAGLQSVVVEKEQIGSGSSGRSASMLMLQRENPSKITLSQFSYAEYMRFGEEVGAPTDFHRIGFLSVVPATKKTEALERARLRQAMGVRTEILTPAEISRLVPVVNVADIELGVFGSDDGVIDPAAIMNGYAAAARRMGVAVRQGVRAIGIETATSHVTAVITTAGRIPTSLVVNAAGADASEVGEWVGLQIPLLNRWRSIFVTAPFQGIPPDSPMVEDAEQEWYYRKEGPGVLMGMGREPAEPSVDILHSAHLACMVEFAMHRVPILAEAQIVRGWSGVRSLTRDLNPIIDASAGVEGFILCCGWGGEGVMHAPAGGQIVADLVTGRKTTWIDVDNFRLQRFRQQ